ncbi:hypothetical protein AOQ84DRAFT_163009 [Glonium stellatum]|uniref:Uncharacterized protein n=1 Tax=Glonium stellatum TaxID=574774 RepID=A0A8E2JMW6_9PEZI|nr:hypothetical protein AOQ84DRAFT_163009 [Glonium stellatum]
MNSLENCEHSSLNISISDHATNAGYKRPTAQQRAAATMRSGGAKAHKFGLQTMEHSRSLGVLPAPLVLPGDELALDPTHPAQSVRSWLRLKDHNEVTDGRRIIYVAMPPDISDEVKPMQLWSQADVSHNDTKLPPPNVRDILDYLAAFFHGLSIKLLPSSQLEFTAWETRSSKPPKKKMKPLIPPFIGLRTSTEIVRIRTRPSVDHILKAQLNLDDLLDAAIRWISQISLH